MDGPKNEGQDEWEAFLLAALCVGAGAFAGGTVMIIASQVLR